LGLPIYRCIRGTNSLEGGVHQNVIRFFGSFNAIPRFADSLLAVYRHMHNLKIGFLHRTGGNYKYHFDIWTCKRIYDLYSSLEQRPPHMVRVDYYLIYYY
jgi:hypothetical protein